MENPRSLSTPHTIADWQTWEGRWELIHGEAYDMTPAPSVEHQRLSSQLCAELYTLLKAGKRHGGSCEVFAAPIDLFLPGEESVYQPDLVVVCDPAKIAPHGIVGVPDLIVELLSPSTAAKDLTVKRDAYEAAGVPEYLVADPTSKTASLFVLQDGRYAKGIRVEWGGEAKVLKEQVHLVVGEPPAEQA
ncbi:MAG TPA: Uma2 family endonuclease [Candidatus Cloacimonadota bacterium]|nr:Uma2 family endonuclease [Candidatus Cloacimonadota bacterium]